MAVESTLAAAEVVSAVAVLASAEEEAEVVEASTSAAEAVEEE